MKDSIPVTKSFLPPIDEYINHVKRAYNNNWLTNRGELVQELEDKVSSLLELKKSRILITNNGTIPLQIALKIFGNNGEIITTPFSYVATTAAIIWENCTPVFVDIHPEYLTIDDTKIEAAITPKTTCILATHVFGNPCNVDAIEAIAKKYQLKVIYDAAHSFGVKYNGESIFEYGDISTCSFHATKIFHTGEGGAIFSKTTELYEKIFLHHAFGHVGDNYSTLGINAKLSELQAAMGLSVLPYMDEIVKKRKLITELYEHLLSNLDICKIKIRENVQHNYSYYPIIMPDEATLLKILNILNNNDIYPRRYFYPSLNRLPFLPNETANCPISESISQQILCLPLFHQLAEPDVIKIARLINTVLS